MNLSEWIGSKKTKDMVFGVIALILCDKLGVSPDVQLMVSGLVGVKIAGQAHIDAKKEAAKK